MTDNKLLFELYDLATGESSLLKESPFLKRCTLTSVDEFRENRAAGYGLRTKEVTGFGLRPELIRDKTFDRFLLATDPIDEKYDVRQVVTSVVIELLEVGENIFEFKTETGSIYRVQYFDLAD